MTLSNLIRKGGLAEVATATPATLATQEAASAATVAPVATVAVAKPQPSATAMTVEEETAIRAWLSHIEETDADIIAEHRAEIVATLAAVSSAEPVAHCPTCGAPSWWLSPQGWCCAYCVPRPAAFTGASLVIADTWADGRAPALDEEPGHPAEPEPPRRDDGRVQNLAGAWRSPEHHAARDAFYRHHAACPTCRRAGQRRGLARCDVGRALRSAYTLVALSDRGGRP